MMEGRKKRRGGGKEKWKKKKEKLEKRKKNSKYKKDGRRALDSHAIAHYVTHLPANTHLQPHVSLVASELFHRLRIAFLAAYAVLWS